MFDPNQFGAMLGSMQDSIKELEEQNKQTILTAKSGGGLVSISCNGSGEVIDMSIDDSLLEDKEYKRQRQTRCRRQSAKGE